jgi:hypothetical protein
LNFGSRGPWPQGLPILHDKAVKAGRKLASVAHWQGRAEDLRAFVGYTRTREEVLAAGEALADRWLVLGQRAEDADAMRVRRTWLLGEDSGREALVVQFAAGARPFAEAFVPGTAFAGEVVFYPSAYPQRAVIRRGGKTSAVTGLPMPASSPTASSGRRRPGPRIRAWIGCSWCCAACCPVTWMARASAAWWTLPAMGWR